MKFQFVFLSLCISASALAAEKPLSVPSDSKAQFFVLEKGGSGAQRTIVTKRIGSSGTSYSKRLYNCADSTVKYLVSGRKSQFFNKRWLGIGPRRLIGLGF